jgi:hypothetical protein
MISSDLTLDGLMWLCCVGFRGALARLRLLSASGPMMGVASFLTGLEQYS